MSRGLNKIYNLLERIDQQYKDYALLTESQESKSIAKAKKFVMDKFGWNNERADKFVRVELRNDLPALRTRQGGKFILGVTRMFCDRQLTDGGIIMNLNSTIELVASDAHINEYDQNLNGLSAQELIDRFAGARKEMGNKDREEVAALELQENNDYTIVQIDNFEQASKYAQYTSWCVTHSSNMLDSYTSDGMGQFYFCLKNGFENVPRERGEGCPLDEYGLSMVAVSVTENGDLNTCTCRWNHDNGGNDNIMDTKQISQLIGRNFYEVFKPNNKWQKILDNAFERLRSGVSPEKVFRQVGREQNGLRKVELIENKYNFIDRDNNLLFPDLWFDSVTNFYENGWALAIYHQNYNYVNRNGELASSTWFSYATSIIDDTYSIVQNRQGKNNFLILGKGLLSDIWFTYLSKFKGNIAQVVLTADTEGPQSNFVDKNGKLVFDHNFDYIRSKDGNLFSVTLDNKTSLVDGETGKFITDKWFNWIEDFNTSVFTEETSDISGSNTKRYARVMQFGEGGEKEYNYIDENGNLFSEHWFPHIDLRADGYAIVGNAFKWSSDIKYNILGPNGQIVSPNMWFTELRTCSYSFGTFTNGPVLVYDRPILYNFLKKDGELLLKEGVDYAVAFRNGIGIITKNRKINYINENGELLSPNIWFDNVQNFNEYSPAARVRVGSKYNLINKKGEFLSPDLWFDEIDYGLDNEKPYAIARDGSDYYFVYRTGGIEPYKNNVRY